MPKFMLMTKTRLLAAVSASLLAMTAADAATSFGASFLGRNAATVLYRDEVAGFVPQPNWNNIPGEPFTGVTVPLVDSTGAFTAVTLDYTASDSWSSDGPTVTPNDRLMKGIQKANPAPDLAPINGTERMTFVVNGLNAGTYDVLLYGTHNGSGAEMDVTLGATTFYIAQQAAFDGTFLEATSTTPGAYADANFARFPAVAVAAGGTITITATKNINVPQVADGIGVSGIQVVQTSGSSAFAPNTVAPTITTQPASASVGVGERATFTVATTGPWDIKWFANGVLIPGATRPSYTTPVTTLAMNGTKYTAQVANNVSTVTSSEATLGVKVPVFAPGFLTAEFYRDIPGTAVVDLTSSAKFQAGAVDETRIMAGSETPNNFGDNYGARLSGFIIPPTNGNYYFFIRSDDASELFLSSDDKKANLGTLPIAEETGCCAAFLEPDSGDPATSALTPLVGGRRYYFEALLKEGGGGDFFQMAIREEADTTPAASLRILTGNTIGTMVPPDAEITVVTQPVNTTVTELSPATFTAAATAAKPSGAVPVRYQWKKNGVDIAGETTATLIVAAPTLADSGTKYSVLFGAPGAVDIVSPEVTLTVIPDTIPPVVVSASGLRNQAGTVEVGIIFDEPLATPASLALANFTLSSGTVTAARYLENSSGLTSRQRGIVLRTTGLTPGSSYTLTVKDIVDVKGNKSAASTIGFQVGRLTWADLATTRDPFLGYQQDVVAVAENGFNVVNGGQSFWGTDDDATFVYEEITGDFDKVARVEFQDPSSNWARAGLTARESLDAHGETASRYQNAHANPSPTRYDGQPSNQGFETNRRLTTGAGTTSSNGDTGANGPQYPNAWVRLQRRGNVISMFRSVDAVTWASLGRTDFSEIGVPEGGSPLPAKMFVGLVFGSENGNIPEESGLRNSWVVRFRDYGDFVSLGSRGQQTYSIGVNFTDDSRDGALGPKEIAGVEKVAQANWNNALGANSGAIGDPGLYGPLTVVADKAGVPTATTAVVEWSGVPNTWASTGRGEENNTLTGANRLLMSGFLDTSGDSTTQIKVTGVPADLTSGKYDVVVYTLGGVASGRGGAFRVTDGNGVQLKDYVLSLVALNPTVLTQVPVAANATPGDPTTYGTGTYVLFEGLSAADVIIEATTEGAFGVGDPNRAPVNAIQLIAPTGILSAVVVPPTLSVGRDTNGDVIITFTGTLNSATTLGGAFTPVTGAASPYRVPAGAAGNGFYRSSN